MLYEISEMFAGFPRPFEMYLTNDSALEIFNSLRPSDAYMRQ